MREPRRAQLMCTRVAFASRVKRTVASTNQTCKTRKLQTAARSLSLSLWLCPIVLVSRVVSGLMGQLPYGTAELEQMAGHTADSAAQVPARSRKLMERQEGSLGK